MNLVNDVYTAFFKGKANKTGNEIHWTDKYDKPITIEPIDINEKTYIIRYYHSNGNKLLEAYYKNGHYHGKLCRWYENGNKSS